MRTRDGRIGAAIAGVMLIGLPAIDLLWAMPAPAGAYVLTMLFGIALVGASAFGTRRD